MSCLAVGVPNPEKLTSAGLPRPSYEGSGRYEGFSPADLRSAYNLPSSGGKGVTVAITIAYDDPKAEEDLAYYRSYYGLSACTTANGCFKKVNQKGEEGNYPEGNAGWAEETSLDLDMVSAACPECHILLVEADSTSDDLYVAVDKAAELGANVISDSWTGEEYASETADDHYFNHPGVPVLFGSGDLGYAAEYPAASPYAIGVGGTSLKRAESSRGWTESAWSGAGSGCSAYEEKPAWQEDSGCAKRTVADVSAVADPETPVSLYDTYNDPGWMLLGGTSVATPLMAGVEALSTSAFRAAGPSAFGYASQGGELFDSTEGENKPYCLTYLCEGEVGYDGPTGWGSPLGTLSLPVAVTEGVSVASTSKATLRGSIRPGGLETKYRFEYGETTAYGTSVPVPDASAGSGSSYIAVSRTIEGLKGQRTYHYRITATNSEGTFHGVDRTFGTSLPSVSVSAATEVHANDATLHGGVNPEGSSTRYWIEFGPAASYGRKRPLNFKDLGAGTSEVKVSAEVGVLTGGHTYHFRISAKNAAGTTYSKDETFTTSPAQWTAQRLAKQHINPNPGSAPYDNHLTGVSCVTPDDCMAVGNYENFVELMDSQRWDGKEWTAVPMAQPKEATEGAVADVSCSSASWCVAVGYYSAKPSKEQEGLPLVETWDGGKWSAAPLPLPKEAEHVAITSIPLWNVSCTSQEACMAVGEYRTKSAEPPYLRPLVYRWDGKEWSLLEMTVPPNSDLQFFAEDVSCVSSSWCMVVGGHDTKEHQWYNQVAEVWNGEGWEIVQQDAPEPQIEATKLRGVSCATTIGCEALTFNTGMSIFGEGTPPVERWDGKEWARESLPGVLDSKHAEPASISCSAVDACTAVGYSAVNKAGVPVAYDWDGSKWSIQTTSEPSQEEEGPLSAYGWLNDVSCPSPSNCVAVGGGKLQSGETRGLIESYQAPGPITQTGPPTNITATHATLHATINPHGLKTSYWFEFGKTKAYEGGSIPEPEEIGSGSSDLEMTIDLWPEPGATYHYRAAASNSEGTTYGEDRTFTLKPHKPVYASTFGTYGTAEGQLNEPLGIALDAKGNVWVADSENNRIEEFDQSGKLLLKFGSKGTGNGQFTEPYALAIDAEGNVWVADTFNSRIEKFNAKGEFLAKYGTQGSGNGQLYRPYGLSFDSSGNLWVADTWNARIEKFNAKGEYLSQFPTAGSPTDVAVDGSGKVWAVEYAYNRVRKYSPEGAQLLQIGGTEGSDPGQFRCPFGVAIDSDGRIWVADSENNRFQEFEPNGEFMTSFGAAGSGAGQMNFPRDVAFDSAGNFWVMDSYNSRIQKWSYPKPPKATTEAATSVKATQATLNGTVNPEGSETGYYFEYGHTTAYGNRMPVSTAVSAGSGTSNVAASQDLSGLVEGTTYHFRLVADSQGGTTHGKDMTLTTLQHAPHVTTLVASSIKATQATLNGAVNPEGLATTYWFEYGPTTSYGTKIPTSPAAAGSGTSNVGVSHTPTGLAENTIYHYRLVAENENGTTNGADKTLTTLKAPKATTEAATSIKATQATVNGTINPEGTSTSYYFEYGTTTSYGTKIPVSPASVGSGTSNVAVSRTPTGLTQGTTYHFRLVAESVAAKTNGADKTLTTLKVPKATTEFATAIKATQASLNGYVNPEGTSTSYYFEYGTTTSYGTKVPVPPASAGSGTSSVPVPQTSTGLAQGTTYHYRLVAESAAGTTNGADKTLTTLKAPKATTEAATSIKATQATVNGTINPEGTSTSYYFEYGTTTSYGTKIPVSPASVGSGTSNVAVSQTPTGLTQATTYHFRVVAESTAATTNGTDKTLTTLGLPENTVLPSISPTAPDQAVPESANKGSWSYEPTSYAYQWQRCNASGGECANISGAAMSSYTPVEADVEHTLLVKVTAENAGGATSALSAATSKVKPIGQITEYALSSGSQPFGIAAGSDGNLWFGSSASNRIGKITTAGTVTQYELPVWSGAAAVALGPDGKLWFVNYLSNKVGKITTSGTITEYSLPSGSNPAGIAGGPDGNLWFTDAGTNRIGKITTSGTITEYSLPAGTYPQEITAGPDGNLWFVGRSSNKVGKITTSGTITEYSVLAGSEPASITKGPDGNLWFCSSSTNKVGKITTSGTVTEYSLPAGSRCFGIVTGADGNLWFTEYNTNKIGRITTAGSITEYSLPSGSTPYKIASGPDNNLWFTDNGTNKIGEIIP